MDTEVVVLIEKEMVGEEVGDDEFDDDWAWTTARKDNPRTRTAARKREWTRPTMAVVVDGGCLSESGPEVGGRKEW